jgi:hypothetical protein
LAASVAAGVAALIERGAVGELVALVVALAVFGVASRRALRKQRRAPPDAARATAERARTLGLPAASPATERPLPPTCEASSRHSSSFFEEEATTGRRASGTPTSRLEYLSHEVRRRLQ